jgi:hypothetical protein
MTTQLREDGPSETSRGRAEDGVAVRQERAPAGVCSALKARGGGFGSTRPRVPHRPRWSAPAQTAGKRLATPDPQP